MHRIHPTLLRYENVELEHIRGRLVAWTASMSIKHGKLIAGLATGWMRGPLFDSDQWTSWRLSPTDAGAPSMNARLSMKSRSLAP